MKELKANMQSYVGTKVINATPMNRLDYNILRGWKLPVDENGSDEGYLVEYVNGGKSNVEGFDGYISWSPRDVFEKSYKTTFGFGEAITALRSGMCIARKCWNGKDMFVCKQIPAHIGENIIPKMQSLPISAKEILLDTKGFIDYNNQCFIVNTNNGNADSWVSSSSDMFAEDWGIVNYSDFKPQTFKDRLNVEYKELEDKFIKLDNFISADDFKDKITDQEQRNLLKVQREFMSGYLETLKDRLDNLNS